LLQKTLTRRRAILFRWSRNDYFLWLIRKHGDIIYKKLDFAIISL
jgi:hypothetical protein